jgi:hypothetical protein
MQQATESIRSRYYNPTDTQEREKLQAALDLGHTIASASRPIPGEESWYGEWCGGRHWAIGSLDKYLKHWQDYDAGLVLLVDNNDLFTIAKQKYDEHVQDRDFKSYYPSWDEILVKYTQERIVEMLIPGAPWRRSEGNSSA